MAIISALTWLSETLVAAGIKATVSDVEVEPVVAGYYGSSSRLTPQFEEDDDSLPSSLFLKMATENQGGRENAAQGGMYRFKVGFYRDLAGLHTPTWQGRGMESCDWAKIDATTANAFAQGMMKLKRSILGRFGAELSGANIEILDRLTVSAPGYWRYSLECENQVAAHWDFRGDNMLFGQRNGELAMVTID